MKIRGYPLTLGFWIIAIIWAIIGVAYVVLVAAWLTSAHAGTCVNRQDGSAAVQSCSNGSYTVYHPSGRVEQWGHRNGGFDRYPGTYYPPRRMRHGE